MAEATIVEGDLLEHNVDAIVNAWNRNMLPAARWTISGVSRAILPAAGPQPFRELRRHGLLPLGGAVVSGAGRLPYQAIINVASINLHHRATEASVAAATRAAIAAAVDHDLGSIAFPTLGAGNGRLDPESALTAMLNAIESEACALRCRVVRFGPAASLQRSGRC